MPRRETYKKVFRNEKVLKEMLDLRSKGWSFPALAARYDCDHSSIIWQVKKHGVEPLVPIEHSWTEKKGARKINQGKDYAGYLREMGIKLVNIDGWKTGRVEKGVDNRIELNSEK